jgi:adenine-specific DNA-methyltransferase
MLYLIRKMAQKKIDKTESDPLHFADQIGAEYTKSVTSRHKKDNGQFFTPVEIAELMASLVKVSKKKSLRILDPGCGTGVLSIALIKQLVEQDKALEHIDLVVYETDDALLPYTKRALEALKKWLVDKGIELNKHIITKDFVLANTHCFKHCEEKDKFDYIISNPPYFKLAKDDPRSLAAKDIVNGQFNIYAVFMGLSAKMLNDHGQLVYITPRSYSSGNYFRTFREVFFKEIDLEKIHLFVSRKDTFSRDSVLQEIVIIKGTKSNGVDKNHTVEISSSHGLRDITHPKKKLFKLDQLIDFNSREKILHFPTNDQEEAIVSLFKSWEGSLEKYDIKVSTGPVVSFRAWDFIKDQYENGAVFLAPLFWLHNVGKMHLEWPVPRANKGQYIVINEQSRSILIPNKDYILLRRFSTKDDKSRLIAAPYFTNYHKADFIGVENKVNYIYRPKGHLNRNELVGLCALLNSELFDAYFAIFNGNVNVSATELREMSFPPLEIIKQIGDRIILSNDYSMSTINAVVAKTFALTEIFVYE